MHEHESQLIAAFIVKERRDRYRLLLSSLDLRRRSQCLDRLNHCQDFDARFAKWLPRDPRSIFRKLEVAELLQRKGCPNDVYVMASGSPIDGRMMPLLEALNEIESVGWGALISCIPGQLAYYYDEAGERHAILERTAKT
jgi:hypothetical protein